MFMGRRGSTSWCSQVARIQWCAGSSGGEPHEVLVRACHDVQVVHVVSGSGNAGAVIAVGHKGNIAVVNLAAQVDADLALGLVGDVFTICAVLDWKDVDT